MSPGRKFGITIGAVLVITLVLGFLVLKPMYDENTQNEAKLKARLAEIEQLRPLVAKERELDTNIEQLKQQLERQRTVVPDDKLAEQFIHVLQEQASSAGIEIRRYTAKPVATRDYYSEVPFEVDIDGPYYGVLSFFQKVSHLERIINISNLTMATPARQSDAKTKKRYNYSPGESVVASFTATTFFSRTPEATPAAPPTPPGKK
jgi:type IV pilus assembly protein PilO